MDITPKSTNPILNKYENLEKDFYTSIKDLIDHKNSLLEETKTELPPMDTPQETAVELDTKEDSKTEIKERPTRNELKSELDKLGITYKPYETLDQLEAKIKQFAGL